VVLLTLGRAIAEQAAPTGRGAAVGAIWGAFLDGLRVQALLLAVAGALCAAAAAAAAPGRLRRAEPEAETELVQESGVLTRVNTPPRRSLAAALCFAAAGALMLLEPGVGVRVLAQALGLYVLYLARR
jgi:hypothetical protein